MALDFFAGCLGGCAGILVGHPFDTIKVRMQTQDYRNPVYRGTWHCFRTLVKHESVGGLYKGMSSPMAGVAVVNAIVFGVYGNIQRNLTDPESLSSYFISGALAGLSQSVIASPMELVKTRLQIQTEQIYKNPIHCLRKINKQEGIRGIFRGLNITGVREFMGYGIYFFTYEALTRRTSTEDGVSTWNMLLFGGLSGCASWALSYPLDVIKTRYQADGMYGEMKYTGIFDCFKKSVSEDGVMCLFRGLSPTLMRAFPTNAVTFTVVMWIFKLTSDNENVMSSLSPAIDSVEEKRVIFNFDLLENKKTQNLHNIYPCEVIKSYYFPNSYLKTNNYTKIFSLSNFDDDSNFFNDIEKDLNNNQAELEIDKEILVQNNVEIVIEGNIDNDKTKYYIKYKDKNKDTSVR